jgi:ribosomal protein S18 acetylase RimI-like enzyme
MRYGRRWDDSSTAGDSSRHTFNEGGSSLPQAELLSIAIASEARGKGVGRALVNQLEQFFVNNLNNLNPSTALARRSREAKAAQRDFTYKVSTSASDSVANFFYRGCGFRLNRQFKHHGNVMNEYLKTVTSNE